MFVSYVVDWKSDFKVLLLEAINLILEVDINIVYIFLNFDSSKFCIYCLLLIHFGQFVMRAIQLVL